MFVYQSTFSSLQLQKNNGVNYLTSWQTRRLNISIFCAECTHFLHSIMFFGHKIGTTFDKDPLDVEQRQLCKQNFKCLRYFWIKYTTKKSAWKFNIKKLLVSETNIVKSSDKEWVYSGYGISFDEKGLWSFGNDFIINVLIFLVDNSSSFHPYNQKNNFRWRPYFWH